MHADGIGFAVPISRAKRVAADLEQGLAAKHAWLGLELAPLPAGETGRGALVHRVVAGAPAASAGLVAGDVVTAVDGAPVKDVAGLLAAVEESRVGNTLRLDVRRDGLELCVAVVAADLDIGLAEAFPPAAPRMVPGP